MALSLPEACEGEHMGHADFRVGGKIFSTLGPDEDWGMVKLTAEQQSSYVLAAPDAFEAISGGWGKRGATKVCLAEADESNVRQALIEAWRNTAPKKLAEDYDPV